MIVGAWLAGRIFYRLPSLERHVTGSPTVLVHDGVAIRTNLRREQPSHQHLMLAIRKQGLFRIKHVKLAILEANGAISVVPREPNEDR